MANRLLRNIESNKLTLNKVKYKCQGFRIDSQELHSRLILKKKIASNNADFFQACRLAFYEV